MGNKKRHRFLCLRRVPFFAYVGAEDNRKGILFVKIVSLLRKLIQFLMVALSVAVHKALILLVFFNHPYQSLAFTRFLRLFNTGDERIELPPKVLETPIIPFDQSPIQLSLNSSDLLSIPYGVMNVKKKIKKIQEMFQGWFSNSESNYNAFIKVMLRGNVKEMNTYMNEVALATFSSFDTGRHPSGKS